MSEAQKAADPVAGFEGVTVRYGRRPSRVDA